MLKSFSISYEQGLFILECPTVYSSFPRRAGFSLDKKTRLWKTPFRHVVKALFKTPDQDLQALLDRAQALDKEIFDSSSAVGSGLSVPVPEGLKMFPYQVAGVEFCLGKPAVLVADEMGLGKTIITIGYMNYTRPRKVLIICPKSLKTNWRRELDKWLVYQPHVEIINYDIVYKHKTYIDSVYWDLLILDEAHYVKNRKASRTVMVFGSALVSPIKYKKLFLLTGTPISNRPIELFELLRAAIPHGFPNKHTYALKYCGAKQGRFGWDYKGANVKALDELQTLLRSKCMLRRLKKDVLKDLPPKFRQVIEIDPDSKCAKYLGLERDFLDNVKGILGLGQNEVLDETAYREVVKIMQSGSTFGEHIATLRRETATAKAPLCFEHIEQAIESSGKVIVFAYHKDVIALLQEKFGGVAVKLDGACSGKQRQEAIDKFQNDEKVKLFIGQITAAGVGITLTASSYVIFVELDWVPGNVTQAEDRAHRIGAKDVVLVQHLVLAGSIDAVLAKTIVQKQEIIDRALNVSETESDKIERILQ